MTSERFSSLIRLLILMLVVMHLSHGNAIRPRKTKEGPLERISDNCPTLEDSKFPESVKVHIGITHKELGHERPHDVSNRSLSPWDYRINEDPDRFPHVITEATCRLSACLDSTGRSQNYGLNSVPIQREILVLKRKQMGCQHTYWLEKQVVTVACTCAIPTVSAFPK
ncbi:interleukin-17A-like [Hemicordylus capensis]|uniref:interleukin-17A-like n=1 Tax=Hemicordylus capensis TaxID=884348 RepID=UPI0023022E01|nr:interleukin-17A-like [Hemicordylus capensis]